MALDNYGPVNYRVRSVSFTVVREPGATTRGRPQLSSPAAVVPVARSLIPDDAREHFVALYLDTQNRLVATHEVSSGTLSASLVAPREVFGPALRLLGVASVVLVHNHPSGDATPSREDLRLTRQLVDAGKLLEILVHDHVILGDGEGAGWVSLAERGEL
jgi:DNA repair protein RadC